MRETLCLLSIVALAGCGSGNVETANGDHDAAVPVTDGSLDETFGAGGIAITDFGYNDSFFAVRVLAEGTILAAGSGGPGLRALLARYRAGGVLDTTFGDQGYVTVNPSTGYAAITEIGLQSEGSIIVAGQASVGTLDFTVSRFSAEGDLDTEFGSNGFALVDFHDDNDLARCMVVLGDDRILVGGYANNGTDDDFALARLTSNGALDPDFGTAGKVSLPIGSGDDRIEAIAVDSSGRILAAGNAAANNGTPDWAVARFTSDGALDSSFGVDGSVVITSEEPDIALDVAILPNGEIVAAGQRSNGATDCMALLKLDSNGGLVSSFGVGGWAVVDFGGNVSAGRSVLRQPDGGLLIAGFAGSLTYAAAIARVDADGELDPTFDQDGKRSLVLGEAAQDAFYDLAAQPDGRIVAAGRSRNADFDAVLVRFDI